MSSNSMARLFWIFLVACISAAAAAGAFGTAEFDLVFPRNDTFAPMPLMPVVFAVQNPAIAKLVRPRLEYGLSPLGHTNLSVDFHTFYDSAEFREMPENETTYFIYTGVANTANTEGRWEFWWRLKSINCSMSNDPNWEHDPYGPFDQVRNGFHWQTDYTFNSVIFTTQKGGRKPDLVDMSSDDECDNAQGLAFEVVGNIEAQPPLDRYGVQECAQFASSTPTPYPCGARVSPPDASSISSSLTQAECYAATPAVSCPPKHTSAASHLNHSRAGWLVAAFAWLLYSVVC